jgi:hypothetical protein
MLIRLIAQEVEPQPLPSSAMTASIVRKSVSYPPKRMGVMIRQRPASLTACTFASGTRRRLSVSSEFASSSGRRAAARPTRSEAVGAVDWELDVSAMPDPFDDVPGGILGGAVCRGEA